MQASATLPAGDYAVMAQTESTDSFDMTVMLHKIKEEFHARFTNDISGLSQLLFTAEKAQQQNAQSLYH